MSVLSPGGGLLAVLLLTVLALPPAQAPASATFGGGDVYELPAGAVVPKDLYVIANEATIDGTVEGDLAVVARRVWLSGTVRGNTNIVAARIEITGRTMGIVRTLGAAQIVPPSPLPAPGVPAPGVPAPGVPAPGAPLPTPTVLPASTATTAPRFTSLSFGAAPAESQPQAQALSQTRPRPVIAWWQTSGQLLLGFAVLSALLLWRAPGTLLKPAGAIAAHPWRSLLVGLLAAQFSLIVPLATGALVLAMSVFWGWFPAILLAAALLAGFGLLWFLSPLVTGVWLGRRIGPLLGRGPDSLPVLVGGVLLLVMIGQIPRFGWLVYLASFLLALGGLIGLAATRSAPAPAPAPAPPVTAEPLPAAGAPPLPRPPPSPSPPWRSPYPGRRCLRPPHRHQAPPRRRPQTDLPPAGAPAAPRPRATSCARWGSPSPCPRTGCPRNRRRRAPDRRTELAPLGQAPRILRFCASNSSWVRMPWAISSPSCRSCKSLESMSSPAGGAPPGAEAGAGCAYADCCWYWGGGGWYPGGCWKRGGGWNMGRWYRPGGGGIYPGCRLAWSWAAHRPACRRDTAFDTAVHVPAATAVRATPRMSPGIATPPSRSVPWRRAPPAAVVASSNTAGPARRVSAAPAGPAPSYANRDCDTSPARGTRATGAKRFRGTPGRQRFPHLAPGGSPAQRHAAADEGGAGRLPVAGRPVRRPA